MATQKRKRKRVSECHQKIAGEKCLGKYELTYENNAPIYTCDKCRHQDFSWKVFYNEYLKLFSQKENWNNKKDQISCIIGFFCFMYEGFYGTPYVFVPKSVNPFSAKECKDSWALLATFNGDANEVRKYLYWVFKHGINKNTTITHFGYVNAPGLVRKYNLYAKRKNILRRESKLPGGFVEWCNNNVPSIFEHYAMETMNDLGALINYLNTYDSEIEQEAEERLVIKAAIECNLIVNGKLNIGDICKR